MNENRLIRELRAFSARHVSFDVNLGAIIISRGWRLGSQSLLVAAMVSIGVMGAILVSSIHMSSQQANGGTFFILRGLARDIREARERDEQVERYRQASIKIKERRRIVKLLSVNVPLGVMIGVLPVLGKFISSVVFLVSWL